VQPDKTYFFTGLFELRTAVDDDCPSPMDSLDVERVFVDEVSKKIGRRAVKAVQKILFLWYDSNTQSELVSHQ